ncbi:MAG: adenylate/guanylate cyclase domain-containing protein [Acidimicrobiia bacterium]|nr:adenylate/guanylate cyclase domain-containing protein [Acidimicrobiia bacterium]
MKDRRIAWPGVLVWLIHMALPLAFVAVLLAAPSVDARWQHNPTHFWLVAAVALANLALALRISREAQARGDARLFLVALSYSVSAAFFGVHAIATPKVLADGSSAGFALAMPAGLLVGAVLAALSSVDWSERASASIIRRRTALTIGTLGLAVAWMYLSLNGLAPLGVPIEDSGLASLFTPLAVVGVALYLITALRYYLIHRGRPSPVALALTTSFVLLAEAMVIVDLARPWQLTWWAWHIVTVAAYGYVAYAAYIEFRREGRPGTLFSGVALSGTVEQLRIEFREALEQLVGSIRSADTERETGSTARRLGEEYGLTDGQTRVLEGAADALATERRQSAVLAAMADISRLPLADLTEVGLGDVAAAAVGEAMGVEVEFTSSSEQQLVATAGVCPVVSHGRQVGVLEVHGADLSPRDTALLESFAGHLGTTLVNLSLYRDIRRLFGRYVSPEVASQLLSDPTSAELGGAVVEMTVLFADLRGFTTFTESIQHPGEVVDLLNRYFAAVVPILLREGGTVDKFVGDAVMAVFNTPILQSDHALRAVRAAYGMQQAIEQVAGSHPDWPRFRIGINTGAALVGNIGSDELRNYTAIGDAVNVAARLESAAQPGQVLMGATTYELVRHAVQAESAGRIEVKGKSEPVEVYRLVGLADLSGTV